MNDQLNYARVDRPPAKFCVISLIWYWAMTVLSLACGAATGRSRMAHTRRAVPVSGGYYRLHDSFGVCAHSFSSRHVLASNPGVAGAEAKVRRRGAARGFQVVVYRWRVHSALYRARARHAVPPLLTAEGRTDRAAQAFFREGPAVSRSSRSFGCNRATTKIGLSVRQAFAAALPGLMAVGSRCLTSSLLAGTRIRWKRLAQRTVLTGTCASWRSSTAVC